MPMASDIRKIAILGDDLPGKCGIATFTSDELSAVRRELLLAPWNKERKTLLTVGAFYSTGQAQAWSWTRGKTKGKAGD